MTLEIVWTKRAENGYDSIVKYLEKNWTEKEVDKFLRESEKFFELPGQYPEIFQKTVYSKNIYRGPMNKLTILTYRLKSHKKQIELINIRSSRQKPLKK